MVLKMFLPAVDMSKYSGQSLLNDISSPEKILAHVHTVLLILSQQLFMRFTAPTYFLSNSLDNQTNFAACQQKHREWFAVSRKSAFTGYSFLPLYLTDECL